MALDDFIEKTKEQLRQESFTSEAEIFQGIMLPVLQVLGWPIFKTKVVIHRYSWRGVAVCSALCHPESNPMISLQIKKTGLSARANRQLIENASQTDVPMAVITDGQEWDFYLFGEQDQCNERGVCKFDLIECSTKEASLRLTRYLGYERVCSGEALQDARSDYQKIVQDREKSANFQKAWNSLLEEEASHLLELLADKFANLCGYRPDQDNCRQFLQTKIIHAEQGDAGLLKPTKPIKSLSDGRSTGKGTVIPSTEPSYAPAGKSKDTFLKVTLDWSAIDRSEGKEVIANITAVSTYIDTLARIAKHVGKDKFSALQELQFNRGSLLSTIRSKYHPKHQVADYYVLTHNGTQDKANILRKVVQELGFPGNFLSFEIVE